MRGQTMNLNLGVQGFVTEECCSCGVLFAMTRSFYEEKHRRSGEPGEPFYCPNGHRQWYTGESDDKKLERLKREKEALAAQRTAALDQRDAAERRAQRARAEATRLKRRAQAAACPCCNRTFVQLARHLKTKHPEYVSG